MVNDPTCIESGNILDLILTSNPSIIPNTHTTPGMSDHEAVIFEVNLNPIQNGKPPRKVFKYKSADRSKLNTRTTFLRRQTIKASATSYKSYVNNQIGSSLKTNPKRFWSFIKANQRENIGIPTLRVDDNHSQMTQEPHFLEDKLLKHRQLPTNPM